ncbi:MAG: hypothetical protein U0O22_00985 [Acutalibacteraceae bacterium]
MAFGQGFDSPHLHHSRPPFDENQVVVFLLGSMSIVGVIPK